MANVPKIAPIEPSLFDDDDDGWQDMPVIRDEDPAGLDEEDRKRYHYKAPEKRDSLTATSNATGSFLDVDYLGDAWRSKVDQNESEYTRLRLNEEDESDDVHLRTRYLFDEDKAMTPLSQMQQTKNMLTEAQRIAYVGLCALAAREMIERLRVVNRTAKHKELGLAIKNMELWALKIMGRIFYHMEVKAEEQKMIESLGMHGIEAKDLAPSLMTTHTVANPEYDPAEAQKQQEARDSAALQAADDDSHDISDDVSETPTAVSTTATAPLPPPKPVQTTARVLEGTSTATVPGVSTHLSAADKDVTLDIRWTVLCDLFLILVADSVYDARSRVLLEDVALKLGLGWLDVVKFERRVTEALDIQEEIESLESKDTIELVKKNSRRRRYVMMGLATLGGGLVIGLSAGLLAPVIGAGLGAAFATVGISGTTGFLAGTAGAAVITTGGVLTGSGIAVRGMARRTQYVRTFDILPLHNNKRVNCILTVPGFLTSDLDDPRLPFSVLDPVVGDVFSVLWEPEMIRETGSALRIMTTEVLTQLGQTVLQATVMTGLMTALQWPIVLTKLGYLIDNPWSNALDRAKSAGLVLADVLIHRHLGVRPITLIGFSLGARVIFYALLELAKQQAFGIVQDVFILGTTVTAPTKTWLQARSAVSGRFVNGYARSDWVLNYLFRATSGGLSAVAGLRPIENVPGLENVDVTDKISGHMSYRTFMPLILDQLGFPVSADYFDEPVEPDFEGERIVVREEDEPKKRGWFSRKKKTPPTSAKVSRPPSVKSIPSHHRKTSSVSTDDDLPPREATPIHLSTPSSRPSTPTVDGASKETEKDLGESSAPGTPASALETNPLPKHAGFDLGAMQAILAEAQTHPEELKMPAPNHFPAPPMHAPTNRSESAPPPLPKSPAMTPRSASQVNLHEQPVAGPSSSYTDLPSAFAHSVSLGDPERGQDDSDEEVDRSAYSAMFPTARREGDALNAPSQLSFGNPYGSAWSTGLERSPAPSFGSPYGGFQDASTFGRSPGGSAVFSPRPLEDPFRTPDAAMMSFGDSNGSITFSPPARADPPDPWGIPAPSFGSYTPKKASSTTNFNLNPWQS